MSLPSDTGLSPLLVEILVCPQDRGPLYYVADESLLYNPRLTRRYEVKGGIPVLLIDEATTVDAAEDARLRARIDAEAIAPTGQR